MYKTWLYVRGRIRKKNLRSSWDSNPGVSKSSRMLLPLSYYRTLGSEAESSRTPVDSPSLDLKAYNTCNGMTSKLLLYMERRNTVDSGF